MTKTVTLPLVLTLGQDYDRCEKIYPDVQRSELVDREGDSFRVRLRFREHLG
jgi:hypothetical protein